MLWINVYIREQKNKDLDKHILSSKRMKQSVDAIGLRAKICVWAPDEFPHNDLTTAAQ